MNELKLIVNSKISVDSFNVGTLNAITEDYAEYKRITTGDVFIGLSSNDARMTALVTTGNLSTKVEAQQDGAYFNWNVGTQQWELLGGVFQPSTGFGGSSISFSNTSIEEAVALGALSINMDKWTSPDGTGLTNTTGETRLFIPISQNTYTISVTSSLSTGNAGGYGIFFDTYLQGDNVSKDYGYVFQFDRGYGSGAMIVRPRANGRESGAVWSLRENNTTVFPNKNIDPDWWTDSHTVLIVVTNVDENNRKAEFFIDSQSIGSFTYSNDITGEQIYTGFRGWGSSPTEFDSISVN